jgi:hypothetical protein
LTDLELADLLGKIDWRKNRDLARLVRSDLAKATISAKQKLGRPAMLTGKMKASIVHRYRLGARVDDLAAEYGVHRSSVYRVLAEKYGRRPYNRAG